MQPRPPEVIDPTGRQLRLGNLLGMGGEGAVYEIADAPELVAKIYHSPLSKVRAAKIQLMPSFSNDAVKKLAAWPIGLIMLKGSRAPIGLTLPRIARRKDIHHLYGPKSRRTEFPPRGLALSLSALLPTRHGRLLLSTARAALSAT